MITLALYCHNYQRRLCWDLSSIAQQVDPPEMYVDVACLEGNGKPTTGEVFADLYGIVNLDLTAWNPEDKDEFQHRGLCRTEQLKRAQRDDGGTGYDWILFSDCDMVYHPEFFRRLADLLATDYKDYPGVLVAGRYSQDTPATATKLVDSTPSIYPCEIPDAYEKADCLPKVRRSAVGAGYFQLINVENCQHGGYYSEKPQDHAWTTGNFWKTRSDHRFRRRIGMKEKLPKWFTTHQIHLSHYRDNMGGEHSEMQR